jgi:hypothetical protein
MMPPATGRGGFRASAAAGFAAIGRGGSRSWLAGRGGAVAAGRGVTNSNPGQLVPDLVQWVIQRGGTSFGWLQPQASQTVSRSISFGYNVRGDLYYPANTPPGTNFPLSSGSTVTAIRSAICGSIDRIFIRSSRSRRPATRCLPSTKAVSAAAWRSPGRSTTDTRTGRRWGAWWKTRARPSVLEKDALEKDSLVDSAAHLSVRLFDGRHGGPLYRRARFARERRCLDFRVHADAHRCGVARHRRHRALQRGARTNAAARLLHRPRIAATLRLQRADRDHRAASRAHRGTATGSRRNARRRPHRRRAGQKIYALQNAEDKLGLYEPWDFTRLPDATQDWIIQWMASTVK